jgi:D-proline reductase (dithiol) PrdB
VALVTTAGVHLASDRPFDMSDPRGDPSYRVVPADTPAADLTITHDYYDHRDADRDINVVFPIDGLRRLQGEHRIGAAAPRHYSLMGHIEEPHLGRLIHETAPELAGRLREEEVDAVLFTPA